MPPLDIAEVGKLKVGLHAKVCEFDHLRDVRSVGEVLPSVDVEGEAFDIHSLLHALDEEVQCLSVGR